MPETADQQLKSFIAKFDPAMGKSIRECRSAMRKRFPTANELVYDNYNFFVVGYCTTERPSHCVVSLAANAKGIGLSFYHGATLPDPHGMLQGSGSQNRFVRLDSAGYSQEAGSSEIARRCRGAGRAAIPESRWWQADHSLHLREAAATKALSPDFRFERTGANLLILSDAFIHGVPTQGGSDARNQVRRIYTQWVKSKTSRFSYVSMDF